MGSRGASHPTRRRTDPAAEHCDPYELVDRAREGALDESSRRRLTMVLRSQRDAALELAWMQLFDAVREPTRPPVREVERTERVVRAIVARVDGASPDGREVDDLARTQRWSAVDAELDVRSVDDDARTRRWPALTGVFEPEPPDDHARTRRWVAIDDEQTEPDAPPVDLDALTQPRASRVDVLRSERVDDDGSRGGRSDRLRARLEPSAPRAATTRTGETAPWTTRPPRRDETPRGTVLEAHPHARGWVALALTAALSIAAGWLAHGWWNAATLEPPTVVASPPSGTRSPGTP